MRRRGLALATVLLVVFVVLLFALTLASLATSRYQLAAHGAARTRNMEAAQAGIAAAMARLSAQPRYGRAAESFSAQVGPDGPEYSVTFDRTRGAPWSVNNLQGLTRVAGWGGRVVPPHSAHLVAEGRYPDDGADRVRKVEAVVQFRSFPYAVAASNRVQTGNGLIVLGASSLTDLLAGRTDEVGHVYAGLPEPNSLRIGGGSRVSGKARTPGTVNLGPGSTVQGGVDDGCEPEIVPDVDLQRFNNRDWTETVEMASGSYLVPQILTGPVYVRGDLDLRLGATLVNAYLFVDGGSLTAGGPLTGTGSVFVTGRMDLAAAANLVFTTGIAVFAGEDLEIRGSALGTQYFQGVLYSHGNVRVRDRVQVVGSVIAAGNAPGRGDVVLDQQATVVHLPEYTQFGSYWEALGMKGSALHGDLPLLKVMHWAEVP